MLERFKVPKEDVVRVPERSLRTTVEAVFEKMGVPHDEAAEGTDVLVMADLRGVETHGVSNMLRYYVDQYNEGALNPRPAWRVLRESPGTATIDGNRGLGLMLAPRAMRLAIGKAREVGVGVVTMRNAGHMGAVGHHAMIAAKNNMVGVCSTSGGNLMVPTFAAEPRFGTNPISIAAPAKKEAPLLFDAATTAIAGNKIWLAERVGADLLPGWISEPDGTPIMESTPPRPKGEYYQRPLGGTREQGSHKGYGFALMAEVLGTLLSGESPSMLGEPKLAQDHYFAAYNIEAFTDLEEFKERMDRMLHTLKTTKPAPGHDRVLYPGLSEHEEEQDRRANGIPLHKEVIEWFAGITSEMSITPLATM